MNMVCLRQHLRFQNHSKAATLMVHGRLLVSTMSVPEGRHAQHFVLLKAFHVLRELMMRIGSRKPLHSISLALQTMPIAPCTAEVVLALQPRRTSSLCHLSVAAMQHGTHNCADAQFLSSLEHWKPLCLCSGTNDW